MKILVFEWRKSVNLKKYGFGHNSVIDTELYELLDLLLFNDLNIMVVKSNNENYQYVVYVDTKSFAQS